ncbi:SDR family oxidoreductase [Actinoalloteichus hymeniacidonis]|uniref:NAD(P)-binding domain-containing protein n=1 Tax=Actinoalloteichus hymeniacidonis TaxID=340345 RepID=A0AAC9MZI1_9PSEU|nr:SDR family oxidoreductase [Actinoalloteichus hymeniacidonis]AOS64395.1 hypothetical protein TL08_17975 [Actinoalloteichus hymeniacidonis]MBB5907537.1 uncharacterized protein YbjT (DUF2867 family) [Actinoalloteichus hymeniacidonis]
MIGVTGATGAVGGRVAALLATLRTPTRLVVRDAARAPELAVSSTRVADYADSAAMQAALDGVRTLFLVSADADPARVQQQTTAVDAAVAAGVEHLVYLSFLGADPDATFTFARDHFRTEEHIRATGVAFTFLRPSLYLDSVPEWVGEDDVLRGPAGDGQVAWVSREDVAQTARAVLTGDGHAGRVYDITGPQLLTLAQTAQVLETFAHRPIGYQNQTLADARASRAGQGESWEIEGWITSYAAIATGEMAVRNDVVKRLTGRDPLSLADFLRTDSDTVGLPERS